MKFTSKALFLASLTYLQCMSGVQAQEAPTNTNLPTALTSISASPTTSGAAPTPSLPSFINTPGLQVTAPYNDMTIFQDTVLSISASILGGRPISKLYSFPTCRMPFISSIRSKGCTLQLGTNVLRRLHNTVVMLPCCMSSCRKAYSILEARYMTFLSLAKGSLLEISNSR